MTPVRHFLIFTLYDLISKFRLLNTVFIEYSIAKSLRDGSSRGTENESGEEEARESEEREELLSGTTLH